MAPKQKRPSLADVFEGLDITPSSSRNPSPERQQSMGVHLGRSIRRQMKSSLHARNSIKAHTMTKIDASFTISMDGAYDYNVLGGETDPDLLFEELQDYGAELREMVNAITPEEAKKMDEHLIEILSRMVFGSNMIENAGGGLDYTLRLCQSIFRGDSVPDEIEDRDPEYEKLKIDLMRKNLPNSYEAILRSRREIVQHAKATCFIITQLYLHGKDLSEEIILETHRILTYKVDTDQGMSWTQYSGVYRQWPVVTGFHAYMDFTAVPRAMRGLIESLETDLKAAIEAGEIDPVALAAKYCHKFVNIHPFLDGNGRICRLILNALLLKYGGILVCIGEQGDDRTKYMEIASNASMSEVSQSEEMEDLAEDLKPKHHKGLASFTLRHARDSVRNAVHALKRKKSE